MELGSFRTEAAVNPPVTEEDLDDQLDDKEVSDSQTATPMLSKHRGSSKRSKKDSTWEKEEKSETILSMDGGNVKGNIDVWWLFDDGGKVLLLFFQFLLLALLCRVGLRKFARAFS